MFRNYLRPNNLSQKMMRVIFSIYLAVTCLITGVQFASEYFKTQHSILNELEQLEQTVRDPITASMWQFDQNQLTVLVDSLVKMPIIEGVDILDKHGLNVVSARSFEPTSAPMSIFNSRSELNWVLNNDSINLGALVLYSSSQVVFDRVWFGFFLIVLMAMIKVTILFGLFIWAFNRYMAKPLNELMLQVTEVQQHHDLSKRISLSNTENNELSELQEHMNSMLETIQSDRELLLQDELVKRNWLEDEVAKRTESLQVLNKKLIELATRDSLTGVLNRGSFFETAQYMMVLAQRQKKAAAFVVMDLDYFKMINDTYGHFIGDKVIVHFTQSIQKILRQSDVFGRIGGEEFALFLPDTELVGAYKIADKIREIISNTTLDFEAKSVKYTVSMGVEALREKDQSVNDLFRRSDVKLYSAKEKGRDRVEW